jgi:hypothetical protein
MIKYANSGGAVLVETALAIGVSLLIVLGAGQMALIGYTQISADGAAFIAAHTAASNPSANSVAAARSVFTKLDAGDFTTPSPSPQLATSMVSKVVTGFSLVPGLASTYSVVGKDIEYQAASANATPAPYAFDTNNSKLHNYCAPSGITCSPSNYCVYLANSIGSGNGNGANGYFYEWRAHQRVFATIAQDFHGVTPTLGYAAIFHTDLDPAWNSSSEGAVYNWDRSASCS